MIWIVAVILAMVGKEPTPWHRMYRIAIAIIIAAFIHKAMS